MDSASDLLVLSVGHHRAIGDGATAGYGVQLDDATVLLLPKSDAIFINELNIAELFICGLCISSVVCVAG